MNEQIQILLERGYKAINNKTIFDKYNSKFERIRMIARRWRNLIGEAQFDIPFCFHEYINWNMPDSWNHTILYYDFVINIPGFLPIVIVYRRLIATDDWYFCRFEIKNKRTFSSGYRDLPLFLANAHKLKSKRRGVKVEEIIGDLAENAKLIKINQEVGSDIDFLNNPSCDFPEAYGGA